ncbi:Cation efflux system protein CusA [Planctomycetes bacterium Pla163]|uniref:Cation efflux system protein CusA n=1 Tax=Rohdeia mirabilis TaxID=2528008 RepID=A0A518CUN1_9BACT|nr:Cation efflux system protein CusA [Planctomycetes bacterium Pla163]
MLGKLVRFFLEQRLMVALLLLFIVAWGAMTAPFDWELGILPRDPVPVDAIPDVGENQQIVFTEWMGRSPQDVEDQITYPLTVSLLGLPGVKTIRSNSFFGFSTIYIIFEEGVEFYWSRSRVLEKLSSLPSGTLPESVSPALGPDATPLGQVFWYTLEGLDPEGEPTGGWGLDELRSVQDWDVRYALMSVDGVAEVASIGGFVREYQVDVDPDAMRAHRVTLDEVYNAVRGSNLEVGARVIEVNRVEYFVRSLGWIEDVTDIEQSVIKAVDGTPIRVQDVANVSIGPALRRGALDKGGAAAVGGVVVVRYGENPLAVLDGIKEKILEITPGLPRKTLENGVLSQVSIVPFYDRSGLIKETLGTLNTAISEEILVTIIVVLFMLMHLRSSVLISALLPVTVLFTFILMKLFAVDANIVALSGIAIAIGTIVDMGIVLTENILTRLRAAHPDEPPLEVVYSATMEVGSAILTAVSTTIVGFLPVFSMIGQEGKLFRPLAFTKTFALIGSIVIALLLIPPLALMLFPSTGGAIGRAWGKLIGRSRRVAASWPYLVTGLAILFVASVLATHWEPLGPERGALRNMGFVLLAILGLLVVFSLFLRVYEPILRWCLGHKVLFLMLPVSLLVFGSTVWLGVDRVFGFVPASLAKLGVDRAAVYSTTLWSGATHEFPGLGKEFMPPLDEGSYLFMPTTMPHASIGESIEVLESLDRAIANIPEVELAVGKIGRVESALDPAPISMVETIINYKPEYMTDSNGHRLKFEFDTESDDFVRDSEGGLISDPDGRPFRNWRPEIENPGDIWDEIVRVTRLTGTVTAPELQPIAARIVMLASGMRAPMGVKVKGPSLEAVERAGLQIERLLKQVPSVRPEATFADRVVGKPYLEIDVDRGAAARYGVSIAQVQNLIEVALGGRRVTTTVEGRERYPVRVRYQRELRDSVEGMERVLVPTASGAQVPLSQLASIEFSRGPQVIKTEDTFLTSYVIFDKRPGWAEVDVVEQCQEFLDQRIANGELDLPTGVSFTFAGSYENQIRAVKTLAVVLPLALFLIFMILYFQFKAVSTTLMVFSGVFVAWSGGFVMLWLYGTPWFLDFDVFGVNMRDLFQVHPLNLSVAVWVGFLALFGIATDDGVVIATYLKQSFEKRDPDTVAEVRDAVVAAGKRRCRPCLMTSATTILALLPVLTSTGRGADVMIPMAIPSFGGMTVVLISMFVVPVLYCAVQERRLRRGARR